MEPKQPFAYCPDCRGWLGHGSGGGAGGADAAGPAHCPYCALPLTGEEHEELRGVDAELAALEHRRAALYGHRQALLARLRAKAHSAGLYAPAQGGAPGAFPPPAHGPAATAWGAGRPDTSSYTVRNVLLLLGGVLLTVAAFAFTLLSWGSMGVGGRAAVLGGLTLCTLAAPFELLRRNLVATAESVAGFGLVLLTLDAYALHEVGFPDVDGLGYTATSAAVVAALWAGYGLTLPGPGLRLPVPFAVAAAQLPLPLWALSLDVDEVAGLYGLSVALLFTFAADAALAVARPRDAEDAPAAVRRAFALPVRLTAAVAAGLVLALLMGVTLAQQTSGVASVARWNAVQAVTAAVLLYAGQRHTARVFAGPLGAAAGLVLVAASGGAAWSLAEAAGASGGDLRVLVYLVCATALLGAVRLLRGPRAPRTPQSDGLAAAAAAVQGGALLWALLPLVEALSGPWSLTARVWQGAPSGPVWRAAGHHTWSGSAAVPAVLLLLALSAPLLASTYRGAEEEGRAAGDGTADSPAPHSSATVTGKSPLRPALPVLPAVVALCGAAGVTGVLPLPYWAVLAAVTALAVGLLGVSVAVAETATGATALVTGLVLALTATGWSLALQETTLGVCALLCAASAAAAAWSPKGGPGRRAALASAAVVYAAGLAGALAAAYELPAHQAAFAVLAVAVGTVPVAARLARGSGATASPASKAMALAVECSGCAAALVGLALCVPHLDSLWPALALCSVAAAGTALRADRRPHAAYLAAVLLVLATWVRLFASDVTTPEAYTLPVSAALLTVGWLRRRRAGTPDSAGSVSSWAAYGGGLAFTFLPSLIAMGDDPHWLRPLLLGTAALGATLAGARWRAQAPLLLGGGTLTAVAVHELAPYVVQVAWLLPRWLVPALAGLLLVAAGATYERRLEEARRLKRAWQKLS